MQPILRRILLSRSHRTPAIARWVTPVGMVCTITLLRICLLGEQPGWPYLTFFPVILMSSLWLGGGSGYIAAVLSSIIAAWAFVPPVFSFVTLDDPTELAGFLLSLFVNLVVAWLIDALHQIIGELNVANARLVTTTNILNKSEAEKALLLDEFSHRVRNDYQRLIGTVMIHERLALDSDSAREALSTVRRRIEATASLHVRLSMIPSTGGLSSIDSRVFLIAVVSDLSSTIGLLPVIMVTNAESHAIPVQQAFSLGLIISEAITNALKYAFPDERAGQIETTFQRKDDGFLLTIKDDGIGLPAETQPRGTGLGSRIIRSLAANLQGSACLTRLQSGGTALEVRFPKQP